MAKARTERLPLGRNARRSVGYACTWLGRESRSCRILESDGLLERKPGQLSGGQRLLPTVAQSGCILNQIDQPRTAAMPTVVDPSLPLHSLLPVRMLVVTPQIGSVLA